MVDIHIVARHATEAEWEATAGILAPGEFGFATDARVLKVGDGNSSWVDLPGLNFGGLGPISVTIDDTQAPDLNANGDTQTTLSSAQSLTLLRQAVQAANAYTDRSGQSAVLAVIDQGSDGTWASRPNAAVVFARGASGRTDVPSWLTAADQYQARS